MFVQKVSDLCELNGERVRDEAFRRNAALIIRYLVDQMGSALVDEIERNRLRITDNLDHKQ